MSGRTVHNTKEKDIFTKGGAKDICTTGESFTPTHNKAIERPAHSAKD